ncbi:MAG TPA: hypothetical protein VE991_10195 [Acidimicrobiales bacterium]|nr:hypothetical protein [Acidimicrobiales bacterium]
MIVIDVLLAANLVVFVVCAWRAPGRVRRPSIDALLGEAGLTPVPARSNVVPFPTARVRSQAVHPSMGGR